MKSKSVPQVLSLLPRHWGKDLCFVALCCLTAALTILEPIVLSELIASATTQGAGIPYSLVAAAIAVFMARIGLTYYKQSSLIRYRNRCVHALSRGLVSHMLRVKTGYLETWSPSYMVSRVIDELSSIDGILPRNFVDSLISAVICIIILILMASQSWLIALLTFLFAGLDYLIAFRLPLTKVYKTYNETQAQLKSQTNNLFQGILQVKLSNRYEKEEKAFGAAMGAYLGTFFRKNFFSQVQRLTSSSCKQFGYLLVIVISAVLIAPGRITLAQFTMLLSLYNLFWSHTTAAENIIPLYKYGQAACDRIQEILHLETEAETPWDKEEKIRSVTFDGVGFAYPQKPPILNGLTFSAELGQITALAGYSGCGKSTALNILLGFLRQNRGQILLNGQAVTSGNLIGLRRKIGYVGQNIFLFNRSIRENLLYYTENTPENEKKLLHYLKLFSLDSLVNALPDGIDHILGDNSSTISGGERQRLCVIRELMKKPDLLILDECTSHLDSESERKIFEAVRKIAAHTVVIQVAHRPSALAYSDMVYVMENGQVAAAGKHSRLIQESAFYQKLLASMEGSEEK